MTTITLSYKALQKKVSSTLGKQISRDYFSLPKVQINWKIVYFMLALGTAVLLVWYVFSINQLTQGAYLIKNYKREFAGMIEENKKLQAAFAGSGFLGSVQEKAKGLQFEKTAKITYIKITEGALASAGSSIK